MPTIFTSDFLKVSLTTNNNYTVLSKHMQLLPLSKIKDRKLFTNDVLSFLLSGNNSGGEMTAAFEKY